MQLLWELINGNIPKACYPINLLYWMWDYCIVRVYQHCITLPLYFTQNFTLAIFKIVCLLPQWLTKLCTAIYMYAIKSSLFKYSNINFSHLITGLYRLYVTTWKVETSLVKLTPMKDLNDWLPVTEQICIHGRYSDDGSSVKFLLYLDSILTIENN